MTTFLKGRSMFSHLVVCGRNLAHTTARTVSCSSANYDEDDLGKKQKDLKVVYDLEDPQCALLNGVPEEQLKTRKARIFSPALNTMQSGAFTRGLWRIEFETQDRWENPLMGWTSSGDPLSNTSVEFASKEDAIRYIERQGWDYEVDEKHNFEMKEKSYGANFSWAKRTRVSTK